MRFSEYTKVYVKIKDALNEGIDDDKKTIIELLKQTDDKELVDRVLVFFSKKFFIDETLKILEDKNLSKYHDTFMKHFNSANGSLDDKKEITELMKSGVFKSSEILSGKVLTYNDLMPSPFAKNLADNLYNWKPIGGNGGSGKGEALLITYTGGFVSPKKGDIGSPSGIIEVKGKDGVLSPTYSGGATNGPKHRQKVIDFMLKISPSSADLVGAKAEFSGVFWLPKLNKALEKDGCSKKDTTKLLKLMLSSRPFSGASWVGGIVKSNGSFDTVAFREETWIEGVEEMFASGDFKHIILTTDTKMISISKNTIRAALKNIKWGIQNSNLSALANNSGRAYAPQFSGFK